jgi:DNA-binding HxlR family transcriptional regulator
MKNTMKLGSSTAKTVPQQELIDAMTPDTIYSQDQIMDLLPNHPRAAVRDTLHVLVGKGIVWREGRRSGSSKSVIVRYSLLEGDALREAVERKTKRAETPEWMKANLTGYEAPMNRHRALCMTVRK